MEEEIKIETQIEIFETLKRNIEYIKSIDKDWFVAFGETLISKIKQLEEENKELLEVKISASAHNRIMELEEENKQLEAIKDEAIRRYNFESIPKSKVKEKIEEIKLSLKDDCLALHEFQRLAKIDVLEEFLREE